MKPRQLPLWLQHFLATMGGGGLFVVAFLDSSVLSFPFVADAIVVELTIEKPSRMPYYAAMATLGSLAGCIWLYLIAKKGGELYFRRHAKGSGEKLKEWVESHAFLSAFIPAILPPPLPFKGFIVAEGVFQVPLRTFVTALLFGRGLRYAAEGILAVFYGEAALNFMMAHTKAFALSVVGVLAILFIVSRLMFRSGPKVR